ESADQVGPVFFWLRQIAFDRRIGIARRGGNIQNFLFGKNGAVRAQSESDRVGRAGVERNDLSAFVGQLDQGVKSIFAEVRNNDPDHLVADLGDQIADQIVRHRSLRDYFFDFERDRIGFE